MVAPEMTEPRELARCWQAVLGRLEVDVNRQTFTTWLRGTRPLRLDGATLLVEARSALNSDWLNQRLGDEVHSAVATVFGEKLTVRFVPPGFEQATAGTAGAAAAGAGAHVLGNLNRAYRFETYITGVGNRIAYECCTSLVESGDSRLNPVVVYGAPGMGKTHLLHGLAHRAAAEGWSVTCLSAEEFTTRYQTALRRKDVEEFQAIRQARLLIIDDLQYLAGKKATQDELVSTIDAVVNAGGFVVCASELHPLDIDLPQRLASRLAQGIVTRVDPFLADERRTFVELQSRERRMALPDWAIERIAGCEIPSVRVLQGTVNAAVALAQRGLLDGRRLDAELVRVAVADVCPGAMEDRAMLERVAKHFQTSLTDLVGRSRKGPVAQARAVAAARLKSRGRSLTEIAKTLGGRDPSTVSGLAERGDELLAADAGLRELAG
jgi:chromosomal replication initiator protein